MNRLKILSVSGSALLALVLSSCSVITPSQPTTTAPPATVQPTQPVVVDPPLPTENPPAQVTEPAGPQSYELKRTETDTSPIVEGQGDNFTGGYIAVVFVTVNGAQVQADMCGQQQDLAAGIAVCEQAYAKDGSNALPIFVLTGTRTGSTAKVTSDDPFLWGTVTFASADANAEPVKFTMATNCLASDGRQGTANPNMEGTCQLP